MNTLFGVAVAVVLAVAPAKGEASAATRGDAPLTLLKTLYGPYEAGRSNDVSQHPWSVFTQRTALLIERDRLAARGESGALDHDPICDCQDFDRLSDVRIRLGIRSARSVTAAVSFLNGSRRSALTYRLKRERGGWRIDDICPTGGPCLIRLLEARPHS